MKQRFVLTYRHVYLSDPQQTNTETCYVLRNKCFVDTSCQKVCSSTV